MKRGSVKAKESRMISVWIPRWMAEAMDFAVEADDTDRSKYIRRAVKEKIRRAWAKK